MITPAPEAVKKSIGHEAAEALGRWVQDILETNAVSRDEYRHILTRLEVMEREVFELKQDVKDFRHEMNERFDRMNERFDRMYERIGSMIKWTIGTLALFGTLITVLLAIGQFVK
jgi:tetrahydromethanopterin S-methyltransferase subunit G